MPRAGGGGIGGKWVVSANICDVSFEGDENVLNLDCGDGCRTLWIYDTKNFMMWIIAQKRCWKKKELKWGIVRMNVIRSVFGHRYKPFSPITIISNKLDSMIFTYLKSVGLYVSVENLQGKADNHVLAFQVLNKFIHSWEYHLPHICLSCIYILSYIHLVFRFILIFLIGFQFSVGGATGDEVIIYPYPLPKTPNLSICWSSMTWFPSLNMLSFAIDTIYCIFSSSPTPQELVSGPRTSQYS